MLETNIDDMSQEIYSYILPKLFDIGVCDAFLTNIIMKKGRPAIKLSILTPSNLLERVESFIFHETTTLGIRKYKVEREVLKRQFTTVKTDIGVVSVKEGYYRDKCVNFKAEYDECQGLAEKNNISLKEVYNKILYFKELNKG